jgi:hypothetical protein
MRCSARSGEEDDEDRWPPRTQSSRRGARTDRQGRGSGEHAHVREYNVDAAVSRRDTRAVWIISLGCRLSSATGVGSPVPLPSRERPSRASRKKRSRVPGLWSTPLHSATRASRARAAAFGLVHSSAAGPVSSSHTPRHASPHRSCDHYQWMEMEPVASTRQRGRALLAPADRALLEPQQQPAGRPCIHPRTV